MSHIYGRFGRLLAFVVLVLLGFSRTGWAYGAPDSFDNPQAISLTSDNSRPAQTYSEEFSGPRTPATTESGEPVTYTDGGGNSVTLTSTIWFSLTAAQPTGDLTLFYDPQSGNTSNAVLRLFRQDGSGFAGLTLVTADTNRSNSEALINFTPTTGALYYLQIGDTSGDNAGTLYLGRTDNTPLALDNDAFENPVNLTSNGSGVAYTTFRASYQDAEPLPGAGNLLGDIATRWFRFTGTGDLMTVTATEGGSDLSMTVFQGPSTPQDFFDLTQMGSGDGNTTSGEQVSFSSTAGDTYYVQLLTGNSYGTIILPPPPGGKIMTRLAGRGTNPMAPLAASPVASGIVSVVSGDQPLPVELSAFSGAARNGAVQLAWTTATERDNAGFSVLRDGIEIASFRSTSALVGGGTTSSPKAYSFTDRRVETGRSYTYTLRSTDLSGEIHGYSRSVTVELTAASLPERFVLSPASPNPFNPSTSLTLSLPQSAEVTAEAFNLLGQRVAVLFSGSLPAGSHPLTWSAAGLPSGSYLVRVTAETAQGRSVETQRVTLAR